MVRRTVRWLALLLWIAVALPARAQDVLLPALHDVTGVAMDDVLNVRAAPRATAPGVGTLRPDATAVEIVRVTDDGGWGLLNLGEGTGWTSMRFLTRQPGQVADVPPAIGSCFGTEPFWSLSPAPPREFRTPEERHVMDAPVYTRASGRTDPWGIVAATGGGAIHGILSRRACSDGMSDREMGLALDFVFADRQVFTGCCTLAP